MALRFCARSGCPNLVKSGYCDDHQQHSMSVRTEKERPSAHKRGYTRAWSAASEAFRREHPLCEGLRVVRGGPVVINTHPGVYRPSELTDHIEPHRGDQTLFWDRDNWQAGCKECHDVKTAREDGGFGRRWT